MYPYENEELADYLNASKAVDGLKSNLSFSGYQCTISASVKYEAIWRLDLGALLGIHHITIYYRTDNMQWGPTNENVGKFLGFAVYISNTTLLEDRVLCFHDFHFDKNTIPAILTLNCTMHGSYVTFQNNRTRSSFPTDYSRYASNDLCEVEVYGCHSPFVYGENCSNPCPAQCKSHRCHIESGHCFGCNDGYRGLRCEHYCETHKYGAECAEDCGHCINGRKCNPFNGFCYAGCETGYYGSQCKMECDGRTYGKNCNNTCGHCHRSCDKIAGECLNGCKPGYKGAFCNKTCAYMYYGSNCNSTCSLKCQNQTCDSKSGYCLIENETENNLLSAYVGGFIGFLSLVVIITAVILLYRRHTIQRGLLKSPKRKLRNVSSCRSYDTLELNTNILQEEARLAQTNVDQTEVKRYVTTGNVYETLNVKNSIGDMGTYQHLLLDIPMTEIGSIITKKQKENAEGFKRDYASLPYGERFPCDAGKLSVNRQKNRDQKTLPYDHSRVILRRYVGTVCDYINANYISGAERNNEYIAAQGPFETTLAEFWEMVCQDQIQQIIMLTNLTEGKQVKFYQYWPNNGKIEIYGTISVEVIEEKVYAFFIKRRFKVSQLEMKSYVVTQFHYTTWLDHETPDPLCLVIFHNHVTNETVAQGISPTLVHCSTGIGRTGTYIALDYLYKTGEKYGSINVAKYVKTMRENRMNMVETVDQYMTVFLALHEAFKTKPVSQSKKQFLNKVTSIMKKGNMISSSLKEEHEILKNVCSKYTDESHVTAKQHYGNPGNDAVLLVDKYRSPVTSTVLARGIYINATVASTYTKENGFIITQYPSQDQVAEFIRNIVDYECRTVIFLDPLHNINSSKAWIPPPSSEKIVSPYRVFCNTCKDTELKVSTLFIHKEKEEPFCITVAEPKFELGSKPQNNVTCLCNMVSFALSRPSNNPIAVVST